MAITEERVYTAGIGVLLLAEIFMSIPLVPDSMVMDGSSFIAILAMGHFFWWLFGRSGMVNGANGIPHILGIFGIFISLMPVIGFIWHGIVAFNLYRSLLSMLRAERGHKGMVADEGEDEEDDWER